MKKLALLALGMVCASAFGQFTEGNLVVSVIGDGGDQADNQPLEVREYTTAGVEIGEPLSLNNVGGRNVTTTYGETSEGQVSRSGNGLFLTICGYDLTPHNFNTFSVYDTPRVVARVGYPKNILFSSNFTVYNPNNFLGDGVRGAFSRTGKDFVVTGGDAGLTVGQFGGAITQYFGGDYSSRSITWYGGQYVYNGSNAYFGGNGLATWNGNGNNAPVGLFASSAGSSREFEFLDANTCYVSTSTGSVGLVKYVNIAGTWTEAYRLGGTGVNGLVIDRSGQTPAIIVTTSNGAEIRKTTDNGTSFSAWTTLASVGTGRRFRGLDWTPNQYETVSPSSIATIVGTEFDGDLASIAQSDDNSYRAFNDEVSLACTVEATGTATAPSVSELRTTIESSAARFGLSVSVQLRNYTTNAFNQIGGSTESTTDTAREFVLTSNAANYVSANGEITLRATWRPINDEDPSQDGWLHTIDQIQWKVKP